MGAGASATLGAELRIGGGGLMAHPKVYKSTPLPLTALFRGSPPPTVALELLFSRTPDRAFSNRNVASTNPDLLTAAVKVRTEEQSNFMRQLGEANDVSCIV